MKAVPKAVLTDGCYVINSVVLGPLFHRVPLEILGRIAPRLALQEVVEVANRVCHERFWRPRKRPAISRTRRLTTT